MVVEEEKESDFQAVNRRMLERVGSRQYGWRFIGWDGSTVVDWNTLHDMFTSCQSLLELETSSATGKKFMKNTIPGKSMKWNLDTIIVHSPGSSSALSDQLSDGCKLSALTGLNPPSLAIWVGNLGGWTPRWRQWRRTRYAEASILLLSRSEKKK